VRTVSLEDPRARIADYCQAQGWQLIEIVTDDGVNGGRQQRLARLAERVKATGVTFVVEYNLDRFCRDVAAMLDTLHAYARRGVALHVVGRGRVEVESASGFLMAGVEGLMAEHYRRLVSEKTRDALARLRAMGRRTSRFPPYGFQLAPGALLVPEPEEQVTLACIATLRASGLSLRAISRELAAQEILARNGQPFAATTLARLVSNRPVTHNEEAF
jgi:DNA invertase Pin-like site-specific DNA recombinase